MLKITEELFLLSLDDAKGRIHKSMTIPLRFTMGGALLADLYLSGKIELNPQKKVILGNDVPSNDPLIDGIFDALKTNFKQPSKIVTLLAEINPKPKKLLEYLGLGLVQQGILNLEEKHYLWVVPYTTYPQKDASTKYWIKQHLRGVVLAGDVADLHTLMLLSLLWAGNMFNLVFTRDEMGFARKRVQQIFTGSWVDRQAIDLAEEIETAIVTLLAATISS